MSDDDRLEEAFRVSLRERAGDVTADGDIAQVAHAGARRRQRIKVGVAGAAAVAVIAPVGILAALNRDAGSPIDVADSTLTSGSSGDVPGNWRIESYDGVQLRVPPDWGWGGVPFTIGGDDEFLTCGHGAFAHAGPDGETVLEVNVEQPYVGRANYGMTDLCMTGLPTPTQPYVWLGSPLEVGSEELENGFTQQTVEAGGLRVTVASDDADELAAILSTVEAIQVDANGCAAVSAPVESGDPVADVEAVDSVSVCIYRHEERGEDVFLGYSTSIEGAPAQHLLEAIKAQPVADLDCDPDPRLRVDDVVLRFHGADAEADVLVRLDGCSGYYTGEGVRPFFTRANVELWVVDGVGLYVSGFNLGAALSDLFHSPGG